MDHTHLHRPRVSRETRLLLVTAFLAIVALWVLARIRFPDQPAPSTPVQPLLTQLGARARFDDLAAELAELRPRLEPLLVGSALRIRSDAAVTLLEEPRSAARAATSGEVIGLDRASRLAVVRTPFLPAPPPVPWMPADLQRPRYLIAADVSAGALALRPVLVGSLVPMPNPFWPGSIWALPAGTNLVTGSFVFTSDALLAGLVVDVDGRRALVPGSVLLAEADRLLVQAASVPGQLGVEVQAMTPSIAKATGAVTGVVVRSVDPKGPSADALAVGDVLEAVDGDALSAPLQWEARAARVSAGDAVAVRLRRGGQVHERTLVAAAAPTPAAAAALGLALRRIPGRGSVITRVEVGSTADRAGLRAGDVITLAGSVHLPSPAAVQRAFDSAPAGDAVLVAFVRGDTQAVTALDK